MTAIDISTDDFNPTLVPIRGVDPSFFNKLVETITSIGHWVLCKIASFLVIVHGRMDNKQLDRHLKVIDLTKVIQEGPYSNRALSIKAQELVQNSLKDLPRVIDTHLHILGRDKDNYLNPNLEKGKSGIKFAVIHHAAGTFRHEGSTDIAAERLSLYADSIPRLEGMILPIHPAVDEDGKVNWGKSGSVLGCETAETTAKKSSTMIPATSIHPNTIDWEKRLEEAREKGILWVKWYPPQGINPADESFEPFYERLKELGMGIIAHSGHAHAVPLSPEWADNGNPKNFESPLKAGVNIILAHSGHEEQWPEFLELARKARDEEWEGKLYGDLSGVFNHSPDFIKNIIISSQEEGVRYINGSDHPYTNFFTKDVFKIFVEKGMLNAEDAKPLKEVKRYNPLLSNLVTLRQLFVQHEGKVLKLPDASFTGEFEDAKLELIDKENWNEFIA